MEHYTKMKIASGFISWILLQLPAASLAETRSSFELNNNATELAFYSDVVGHLDGHQIEPWEGHIDMESLQFVEEKVCLNEDTGTTTRY